MYDRKYTGLIIILGLIVLSFSVVSDVKCQTVKQIPFEWYAVDMLYADFFDFADDDYFDYRLPWPFPYNGKTISMIRVCSNGYVELVETGETPVTEAFSGTIDDFLTEYPMADALFAAMDDLCSETCGYYAVKHFTTPVDMVVVYWHTPTKEDDSPVYMNEFEIILYKNGEIQWNYNFMDFDLHTYDMFAGMYDGDIGEPVEIEYDVDAPCSYSYNYNPANHLAGSFKTKETLEQSFEWDTTAENDVKISVEGAFYTWLLKMRGGSDVGGITTARYESPPQTTVDVETDTGLIPVKYVDVSASGFVGGKATITVYYTEDEVIRAKVSESSLTLYYWNGIRWIELGNVGRDTEKNIVWGELFLTDLIGTPIVVVGKPLPVGGEVVESYEETPLTALYGFAVSYWWVLVFLVIMGVALIFSRRIGS